MKFAVTAVALSRKTRRRVGKAREEIINTVTDHAYRQLTDPKDIETAYEHYWNDLNPDSPDTVKVVDVRQIKVK